MLFICYPKCTTCQKARRWLDEHGVNYTVRDIKAENPSLEELHSWYSTAGQPIKRLFNTSGQLYKSLGLKEKLGSMSEDEALEQLSTDGMLVKRPIIVDGSIILIGFNEMQWSQVLL